MKKKLPINLKEILLTYEDGTILRVPEKQTLKVGTTFMKIIGSEGIEWEVLSVKKREGNFLKNLVDKFIAI